MQGLMGGPHISIEESDNGITVIVSGSSPSAGIMGELFGGMFGGMYGNPKYTFGSGHLDYDPLDHLPGDVMMELQRIGDLERNTKPMEVVVKKILDAETSLNAPEARIKPFIGRTREAIDYALSNIAMDKRRVALPVPNWSFWQHMGIDQGGLYSFDFFRALNPEELVTNFQSLAKTETLDAVILTSPSNPIGYRIDSSTAKEIDKIAQRYGVAVVVDDLLRGVQPLGDRESIAVNFSQPYVIEGFSHRFGQVLGEFSYILVPEGVEPFHLPLAMQYGLSEAVEFCYEHSSEKVTEELVRRNNAFDEGIRSHVPDIEIVRPSKSSITSVVTMPEGAPSDADSFCRASLVAGVRAYPVNSFMPRSVEGPLETAYKFRVAIGSMPVSSIKQGATILGDGLSYSQNRG